MSTRLYDLYHTRDEKYTFALDARVLDEIYKVQLGFGFVPDPAYYNLGVMATLLYGLIGDDQDQIETEYMEQTYSIFYGATLHMQITEMGVFLAATYEGKLLTLSRSEINFRQDNR